MYEFAVSLRYLKSRRHQTFISLITVISIGGVGVGVMVLIVVLAVMSGFEQSLQDKILGINSHVWVFSNQTPYIENAHDIAAKVRTLPHVTLAAPFTTHEVMLVAEGRIAGTILRGVDPSQPDLLADFRQHFGGQDLQQLLAPPQAVAPANANAAESRDASPQRGIILGKELARSLLAFPGMTLLVNSPLGILSPAGIMPNVRRFTVTGTFTTGMYEYDNKLAIIALDQAQDFFDMGAKVNGIEVKVDNLYRVHQVTQAMHTALGPGYWTRDWMQMNRSLFAALRQEKVLMFIILVLIILVAAFNIISTLVMMTMEKRADIAVLKSMGARRSSIQRIFMLEGLIIGGIGTVCGTIAGLVFTWNLQTIAGWVERLLGIQLFPPDVYFIDQLPAEIRSVDIGFIVLTAIIISFVATLYPAWNASRLDPVVALRYE